MDGTEQTFREFKQWLSRKAFNQTGSSVALDKDAERELKIFTRERKLDPETVRELEAALKRESFRMYGTTVRGGSRFSTE